MSGFFNIEEFRKAARRRLPRFVFDYIDGGSEDEIALRENRNAFERVKITPRLLKDVSQRDQSIDWFGTRFPSPLVLAPTGLNGLLWHKGDIALARAAERTGVPFTLSTASNSSIEEVARSAGGDLWFQLYVMNRNLADDLATRALAADYSHLILTVDVPLSGRRERDERNQFVMPFKFRPATLVDIATHPRWLWNVGRHGAPAMANLATAMLSDPNAQAALLSRKMDASYSWDDLKRLRDRWPRKLLVKGLLHPEDAAKAISVGVDGVIVSNHGGRQLDSAPASLAALAEFKDARTSKILDGGIRRGSDILKALDAGANAVMVGRAALYGLAAEGEDGVAEVIRILKEELDRTMALAGRASLMS